jgi:hypothetical protein
LLGNFVSLVRFVVFVVVVVVRGRIARGKRNSWKHKEMGEASTDVSFSP